jgi:hypothetical protein
LAAIRADGDDPWAHLAVGATHLRKQHFDSALAAFESALRLSPRDPFAAIYSAVAAYAEFVGRNYEEAIRLGRESIRQGPDMVGGYRPLAAAAAMVGDMDLSPGPPSTRCAAFSPMSRSPGWQATCSSARKPSAPATWTLSGAPA